MPPTNDNNSGSYNKIPEDDTLLQPSDEKVDHSGWKEHVEQYGSSTDKLYPHVRYGFIDGENGLHQEGLIPLKEDIPSYANFVSTGIYFLTQQETAQVSTGAAAKRIQEDCEEDGRVAYTVVAESDAMEDGVSVEKIINWLVTLATDKLNLDSNEYSLYYSGNRSIHLHSSYFVRHENLGYLKNTIEEFCQELGADLDLSIYKQKSQFRLIGAKHRNTDMFKVEIPNDADRVKAVQTAQNPPSLSLPHHIPKKNNNLVAGSTSRGSLPSKYGSQLIREYLNETTSDTDWDPNTDLDGSYTNRYFSPYANTGGGERSICVFEPQGGAFCRQKNQEIYLPCYIYGARGANGEYVIRNKKAPVLLSKVDYEKREFESGERLVIIGGQSRSSRIFCVDECDKDYLGQVLNTPDNIDRRKLAFDWLELQEYSIGESGMHGEPRESVYGASSDIQQLKEELVQMNRHPTHNETVRVTCSILNTDGLREAWQWNKRAWGDQFDSEITRQQLIDLVQRYDYDEYNNKDIKKLE